MKRKKKPDTWPGEKRMYERLFYSVLLRRTKVYDIPPEEGELGYTTKEGDIHEAYTHPVMDGLTIPLQIMFRYGVFVHEMMHQVYTDFSHLEAVLDSHPNDNEKRVLSLLANLVEDPSIEYFADQQVGGDALESLRFSIRHIYDLAESIEKSQTPWQQLVNALIQFGDMGIIKGNFTFPEAQKCFCRMAGEFNRMVICPDARARIDAAERWMMLTRPLWAQDAKDKDFPKQLQQIMDEHMNGGMKSSTNHVPVKPEEDASASDVRAKRRASLAKSLEGLSEEEASEILEKAMDTFPEEDEKKQEWSERAESLCREAEEQTSSTSNDGMEDSLNLPVVIPKASGKGTVSVSCDNIRVAGNEIAFNRYSDIVSTNNRNIQMLTRSIKSLLMTDQDDLIRTTSGKYCLKRDLAHTSVRIFDKKKERKHIDDMAVMLLVDMSGSMMGRKISIARDTAVILSEVFARLAIPCYVMGFTADTGKNVTQYHYVRWNNTRQERASLGTMHAYANNDDGYSIRYATQLLNRKQAEHKLLFVISDGAPACNRYRQVNGVHDTALAIKGAKKICDVFGIGIGMIQCQELKQMYRGTFVEVQNVGELPIRLAKQLKQVIRGWL